MWNFGYMFELKKPWRQWVFCVATRVAALPTFYLLSHPLCRFVVSPPSLLLFSQTARFINGEACGEGLWLWYTSCPSYPQNESSNHRKSRKCKQTDSDRTTGMFFHEQIAFHLYSPFSLLVHGQTLRYPRPAVSRKDIVSKFDKSDHGFRFSVAKRKKQQQQLRSPPWETSNSREVIRTLHAQTGHSPCKSSYTICLGIDVFIDFKSKKTLPYNEILPVACFANV